jgi:hypothetical protein
MVKETTSEDEDGKKTVVRDFTKEGLAYALARINIRYKTLSKMLPRKWGEDGHGLEEPAPLEPPRISPSATAPAASDTAAEKAPSSAASIAPR